MEPIKKEYSLKQLSSSEQDLVIQKYLSEVPTCKQILCHQWFRGFCSFPPEICKYAHGLSDLEYEKASQRPNKKAHIKDDDIVYIKHDKRNYQILKDYMERLRALKTLKEDEDFSLEELNAEGKLRTKVRNRFFKEFTLETMQFFFSQYPNVYLSKKFIDREFELIKFPIKVDWLFNGDYYFLNDIPLPPRVGNSFKLVLPFGSLSDLEQKLKNVLREIVSELQTSHTAITEKQITAEYYKKKVFDLPTLNIISKKLNKGIDHFVAEILNTEEEKSSFISMKDQKEKFLQNMEMCIKDFWDHESRQRFAFGKISDLFKLLAKNNFLESGKDLYQNEDQMLDVLILVLIRKGMLLIFMFSETFIINLNLLVIKSEEEFHQNLDLKRIKSKNCNTHEELKEEHFLSLKLKEHEKINEKWVFFNDSRIVTVDDSDSLYYSKEVLSHVTKIGVDIEGQLCEGGSIDLIQIGIKFGKDSRKIFIFDIHHLKSQNPQVYTETKIFLKSLIQNHKVLKVFHDCRKDSLALHLFLDSTCPTLVYDTACLHILIEQLKVYKTTNFKELEDKKVHETLHQLRNLLWPGLNVVLSQYNATHGINILKEKMKKKFDEEPRSFFLQRPINTEFLEYSAKDVEDLVEVSENQEKVLDELFACFNVNINESFVREYLMEKVSYYYVREGCVSPNDSE